MRTPDDLDAAITGIGLFTGLGLGVAAHDACLDPEHPASEGPMQVQEPFLRATVPEDLEAQAKFLNGSGQMAATVVAEAVAAARLASAGHPAASLGLYLAQLDLALTAYSNYRPAFADATENFTVPLRMPALNAATIRRMNPFHLLEQINNNAFSFLSAWHGLRGANTSLSGWSGPGLETVALAARAVRRGDAKATVACGAGRTAGPVTQVEIERLRLLPAGQSPGDAAAAMVLEPKGAAEARGAAPITLVMGNGAACIAAEGRLGAAPQALVDAVTEALADAGARPEEIDVIVAPRDEIAQRLVDAMPTLSRARLRSFRAVVGHVATASDVVDVALTARWMGASGRADRPRTALVLAAGIDGQAGALVLRAAS